MTPAPAKINLGLHVLRRRPDGYHDVRTLFLRIGWADFVSVGPAAGLVFACSDRSLPAGEQNLCVRAAIALAATAGVEPDARIHLEKHVPIGAGLGGGSSDAATTLILLDDLWGLGLPRSELVRIAASIGSDVPFFLFEGAAIGEGRGERILPLVGHDGAAYRMPFPLCVVVPDVSISTAEAYRLVGTRDATGMGPENAIEDVVRSNDLERWAALLVNDFEKPLLNRHPEIGVARQLLIDAGAGYASLSGSGSAVFGGFEEESMCSAAAETARLAGLRVWWGYASA